MLIYSVCFCCVLRVRDRKSPLTHQSPCEAVPSVCVSHQTHGGSGSGPPRAATGSIWHDSVYLGSRGRRGWGGRLSLDVTTLRVWPFRCQCSSCAHQQPSSVRDWRQEADGEVHSQRFEAVNSALSLKSHWGNRRIRTVWKKREKASWLKGIFLLLITSNDEKCRPATLWF